jgi:phenylpyruvate tautomerase PptA (4-oxalocrotonate tautomerase family)
MPITVTAPAGVLTHDGERAVIPRLTHAVLDISGGIGNDFFTSLIGGILNILPPTTIYGGGVNRPIVIVELKLPNIGLPSLDNRREFIDAATRIVAESTRPDHDPKNIWVNVINAPDGGWGIAGQAYTGDELINSIAGQAKANSVIDSPS